MEKIEQKNFLLELAEQNKEIIYKDNKVMAKLSWLKPWEKNPKFSSEKDLKRLKTQIEELGVYKPLLVYLEKDNATILGGNQRYKVLKELSANCKPEEKDRYEYVWVSVVNAENDYDKLRYALSDNEQIGKYDRSKLKEQLETEIKQGNLFNNYSIDFEDGQTIDKMIDDLNLTEEEYRFKNVKKSLIDLGINKETVDTLEIMVGYNKINEDLPDIDIQGKIVGQKFPMLFWFEDKILYENMKEIFKTTHKDRYDDAKLKEYTETILGKELPTSLDELQKLLKKAQDIKKTKDAKVEFGDKVESEEKKLANLKDKIKDIFYKTFPEEIKY